MTLLTYRDNTAATNSSTYVSSTYVAQRLTISTVTCTCR